MLEYIRSSDRIEIMLTGEIDHHSAEQMRQEIEHLLMDKSLRLLTLNFDSVTFMDSSGVGMVIGRYKTMKERGGEVQAVCLHPPVDRIFRLAGLHRIITTAQDNRRKEA